MTISKSQWLSTSVENRISANIRQWNERGRKKASESQPLPFITISRQYGARARPVAKRVEELLNQELAQEPFWTTYDNDIINEMQVHEKFIHYLDREKNSLKVFLDCWIQNMPDRLRIYRKLMETMVALASQGRCILVGKGGGILTKKLENGLRVRIIDSMENRIKRIMEIQNFKTEAEANKYINQNEKEREAFVKEFSGQCTREIENYDLIIRMTDLTVEKSSRIIVNALKTKFDHIFEQN